MSLFSSSSSNSNNNNNNIDNKNIKITIPIHKSDQAKFSVSSRLIDGNIYPPISNKIDTDQLLIFGEYSYVTFNSGNIDNIINMKDSIFQLYRFNDGNKTDKKIASGNIEIDDDTIRIYDNNKQTLHIEKWPSKHNYLKLISTFNPIKVGKPSIQIVGVKNNINKDYINLIYFEPDTLHAIPHYTAIQDPIKNLLTIIPIYSIKNKTKIQYSDIEELTISTRVGQKKQERKQFLEVSQRNYAMKSSKSNVILERNINIMHNTNTSKSIKLLSGPYNFAPNSRTLIKGNTVYNIPSNLMFYLMPHDDINPSPWLWFSSKTIKQTLKTIFDGDIQLNISNSDKSRDIMGTGKLIDKTTKDMKYLVRFPSTDAITIKTEKGTTSDDKTNKILTRQYIYTINNLRINRSTVVIVKKINFGDIIQSQNRNVTIIDYKPGPGELKRNDLKSVIIDIPKKTVININIKIISKY